MLGRRATPIILTVGLFAFLACGGDPEPGGEAASGIPTDTGERVAQAELPKLSAEELAPVIREVSEADVGPNKIDVELARPVVTDAQVGQAPGDGTVLRIEPPVAGELRFTSPSTLSFVPTEGFHPATRYEVELVSLETGSSVLEAPEAGRWVRVFTTPEFDFARFSLASVDYTRQRAEVQLVFSAAVNAQEVSRRAHIVAIGPDGQTRRKPSVRFVPGPRRHTVIGQLTSDLIRGGGRLELALEEGVPSALGEERLAGRRQGKVDLALGPVAKVLTSYRAEGTNGFYVQVVCDDAAVSSRRYYWDRTEHEYYQVSTRCLPAEADAEFGIHFEPPVNHTVSPAGGGFRIFGDFARGSYHMRIEAGLRTADGGMLHEAHEAELSIPARSPSVRFVSKGRYLPRGAWKSLPVRHLNLADATLSVRHVPRQNMVFWMSDDESEAAGERTADLILKTEVPLGGASDVETTTYVDLASLVPADTRGLLEVRLEAGENGDVHDTARILLTDLHLVAKRAIATPDGSRAVHAWALHMETLGPVRGTEIALVRKSGHVVDSCTTGRDGGCRLVPPAGDVDPSAPFALIASAGDELTYLKFSELEAEVQEERISGESYLDARKYKAAVYSDRGVYRPGETAHLAAIVRDTGHLAPPAEMPVVAQLADPRGKTLKRTTLKTNAAGYLDMDVDFPAFAATGRYEVKLEVAEQQIGQYRFQVEEFVPERMKVEVSSPAPQYLFGEPMEVTVGSRYLFGGVPANHKVEVACEIAPGSFSPEENANFHYGVWTPESSPVRPLDLGKLDAELDAAGGGTYQCPGAGRAGGFRGPAQLIARAAVFESGSGRATVNQTTVPVHPERFYLGLMSGTTKVEAGNDLVVDGVAVDWQGKLVDDVEQVELELIRLETEYGWYYDEARGYESYRRYLRPVTEATVEVPVTGGKFRQTWKPGRDGVAFLVRASAGAARTDLELEGRGGWYWWAPQETEVDQTPRPGRPAWLALDAPDKAAVGERFSVRFNAPYRGRVLLTAETDRVLDSEWLDVDAGETEWRLKLDEFAPNVYVTAFLVKDPHLDSSEAFLPDRAFGVRSVTLEPKAFTQEVELEVPSEVRSGSTLTVSLDLGGRVAAEADGPTWATVAAVDEGVLSLTRFQSPDPFRDIFARRALGVETFETVGWTLLVPPVVSSDTAGGDGAAALGRVQQIKPVALWSGLLEVPSSGRLEVDFDLPQYRGELRVMAVTAGAKKMGRADASVTVRDPLVVQATLPRFLTADDEIRLPVFVTNLSGERRDVEVSLTAEALAASGLEPAGDARPVEIVGTDRRTLTLDHGAGDTAVFRARAVQPTGAARLRVSARSRDIESVEEIDVPLLPAGPKSRRVQRVELAEGTVDLTGYLDGWLPLSERSTLWVTANPYGDAFDHLEHLVRYPYGCLEQTASSTRPLLFLASFIDRLDPEITGGKDIEEMATKGVRRLLSMQTPDGGFAYWPGGTQPAYWGTAYATHLLIDAQKLDYPVPQERLDEALDWMDRQVTNLYEAGREERDWYSRDAEPYMHFVLARAGRARKARAERLLAELPASPKGEQLEHRFMLRAALYQAGDHRYENELKRPDLSPVSGERRNGWSFYSDRRRRGFMLATFVDLFGRDPAGEPLANLVAEALRGRKSRWYTTQELVWGVTGLGKFVEAGAREFEPPTLVADGRRLAARQTQTDTSERTWDVARASEYRRLDLEVPKKSEGKLYLILSSEGVREVPDWRTGGEGMSLRRRYLDAAGKEIQVASKVKLGDLVYVELTARNTSAERIANIALVDRIPAGWEIENPRLGRDATAGWLDSDDLWQVDHMDLRDDRIELFGHLDRGETRKVVYAARAVTAGRFTIPPVEAEAMYDPRIWAREATRRIEIAAPGDGVATAAVLTPSGVAAGAK
ncbi:MAG: hypothetical protein GY719_02620 [bacterium]|nr:hypothetical protein [bacterium]